MDDHGFWIPLTILFVMRPDRDETYLRLVLRAVGHRARADPRHRGRGGFRRQRPRRHRRPHRGAAFALGLLTVQYALFTAAITVYVVLLTDTLGESAWEADEAAPDRHRAGAR